MTLNMGRTWASLVAQAVENLPAKRVTRFQSLGREDLEKGMATHSSTLAWRIQWTEECHDIKWFALETNRDHSVVFEIVLHFGHFC